MKNKLSVELVYISSVTGFKGVTVNFIGEGFAVTLLGKHSKERLIEITTRWYLEQGRNEAL